MSKETKEQLQQRVDELNDLAERNRRRAESLSEALDSARGLIGDLEEEIRNMQSRAIGRNSDYEAEIRRLNEAGEQAIGLATEALTQRDESLDQRNFLAQALIAISFYRGKNPMVPAAIAISSVSDFMPPEEKSSDPAEEEVRS